MDINTHNFMEDEEFQIFFHSKLANKRVSRAEFIRILNKCKREWLKLQHNVNYLAEKCRRAQEA